MPDTDKQPDWLDRAKNGDAKSISQMWGEYAPRIYRYVRYRVGTNADAEDLTSEVMLRAIRRLRDVRQSFAPWIFRIARNLLVDFFRKRSHAKEYQAMEYKMESASPVENPEHGTLTRATLERLLPMLSGEQQEVILLRFVEDFSPREIAKQMGKHEDAVRAIQYRGLRRLKELLSEENI